MKIPYQVTTLGDDNQTYSSCSIVYRDNEIGNSIIVIPAITDNELFTRLVEYGNRFQSCSPVYIEKEIRKYTIEKYSSITYRIYANVECYECCSDDDVCNNEDCGARGTVMYGGRNPIHKGTQQLLSKNGENVHVYVGVLPPIEDIQLKSYLNELLQNPNFIPDNNRLTTKGVIELVQSKVNEYQLSLNNIESN